MNKAEGGGDIAYEMSKNDDIIQLKQMIIFLKAELIQYETMDSVSEINRLKQDNRQLIAENEALQNKGEAIDEKMTQLLSFMEESKNEQRQIQKILIKMTKKEKVIEADQKGVGKLEKEILRLTAENDSMTTRLKIISPESLQKVDEQMQEIMRKSLAYAEKIDEKLALIGEMERKLVGGWRKKN